MEPPKPGHVEAIKLGCQCPVRDNGHGKGALGDGGKRGWWVDPLCPVHGDVVLRRWSQVTKEGKR